MKPKEIEEMIRNGMLRQRSEDKARARSLLASAEQNAKAALAIKLDEATSTIVFREIYECVRQLGDAKLWLLGYEATSHEASMAALMDEEVKDKVKLNQLDRFRQARNNANYRGYVVSAAKAKEIAEFWDSCGKELLEKLGKRAK